MKRGGLYPKLAAEGMRKNRRLYLPYLLTCVCMVMMHYILSFLAFDEQLKEMRGGGTLGTILYLGSHVVLLFSLLFLFYTNSFLIRRRHREFGLYNVLGMGKRELARIISWEALFSALTSLGAGLFLGIALSKLAELGLIRLLHEEVNYSIRIIPEALKSTLAAYAGIFVLIWAVSLIRVGRSTAVALMKSENVGEKPPKANWLFGLGGVILLVAAYWLAINTDGPLEALMWFFTAVLMVIAATYMIMISGSVLLCRLLQKNRKYYYNPRHFVSVSSMAYRMKRNGAGLASICILATMVLVMISSTTCLYVGMEDALSQRYPRDIVATVSTVDSMTEDRAASVRARLEAAADEFDAQPYNVLSYRELSASGVLLENGCFALDEGNNFSITGVPVQISIIPLSEYNDVMGTSLTLSGGEAYYFSQRTTYDYDRFYLDNGPGWNIRGALDGFEGSGEDNAYLLTQIYFIVPDFDTTVPQIMALAGGDESSARLNYCFGFDTDLPDEIQAWAGFTGGSDEEKKTTLAGSMWLELRQICMENEIYSYSLSAMVDGRDDFYGTFGGLFFIGIILSVVFILAAVLIIYYKQISEGYEDRARYEIMRKVGMTKKEIRRSINSQLLTVFYLPLLMAGLHMAFAFPMIRKLLTLFLLYNVRLFALTTLVSFAVFALFYALVYRFTSNAYYNIVSSADEQRN